METLLYEYASIPSVAGVALDFVNRIPPDNEAKPPPETEKPSVHAATSVAEYASLTAASSDVIVARGDVFSEIHRIATTLGKDVRGLPAVGFHFLGGTVPPDEAAVDTVDAPLP